MAKGITNDTSPLRVYVAGPYSAPTAAEVKKNISWANRAALKIAQKGHIPFVPHTMLGHWEDRFQVDRDIVMKICQEWLKTCDAIMYLRPSPGADKELRIAKKRKLRVFHAVSDIPHATTHRRSPIDQEHVT